MIYYIHTLHTYETMPLPANPESETVFWGGSFKQISYADLPVT